MTKPDESRSGERVEIGEEALTPRERDREARVLAGTLERIVEELLAGDPRAALELARRGARRARRFARELSLRRAAG